MDETFLRERIASTKAIIIELETAMANLVSGAILSYTLDTGQTRQTVTRLEISSLKNVINSKYNLLSILEARLTGGGVITVNPVW